MSEAETATAAGHSNVVSGDILRCCQLLNGHRHSVLQSLVPREHTHGYLNQPTNVFMIKGTTNPAVVPTTPTAAGT